MIFTVIRFIVDLQSYIYVWGEKDEIGANVQSW